MLNTGKSFSEALSLESTNPQYEDRLFIDLRVQYMLCTQFVICFVLTSEQSMYTTCSELAIFMYWTRKSMNLSSYYGLIDAKIKVSDKDLPVCTIVDF